MPTISITSNEGALDSASAVLEVTATNPEYNQPALRIGQASKRGGAASIRIDDPNPDIEFVETDQAPPAGKYEIAVQSDKLQINGRNADDIAFEPLVVFQRRAAGGNIGIRTASQFEEGLKTAGLAIDSDQVFSKIGLLPSRLASLIFYKRHPVRHRRSLKNGEPGIGEWLKICDDIVCPQLFRSFLPKMTVASCLATSNSACQST